MENFYSDVLKFTADLNGLCSISRRYLAKSL